MMMIIIFVFSEFSFFKKAHIYKNCTALLQGSSNLSANNKMLEEFLYTST